MTVKLKAVLLLLTTLIVAACNRNEEENVSSKLSDQDCIQGTAPVGTPIPGEYIVTTADQENSSGRVESFNQILASNHISNDKIAHNFKGLNSYYVMQLSDDDASRLKRDNRIINVEPDRIIAACGCFSVVAPKTITWNVKKVGYGDGTNKTAWIVDSGISTSHPDLNVDKVRSRSFLQSNSSIEDENGHGTHVSGIIGALNNHEGVLGVASGAKLVALRVLDKTGQGKLSSLLNALVYIAVNASGGDVVNISMGFPDVSDALEREIQSIANKGVFFAIAAGNNSKDASTYSPARTSGKNIYTVSAIDSLNRFASFSNYGDAVDYAAPGVKILSTYTEGRYAVLSGTSMAAPHVAGLLLINKGVIHSYGKATKDPDGNNDPIAHR
jgi:subtilisin